MLAEASPCNVHHVMPSLNLDSLEPLKCCQDSREIFFSSQKFTILLYYLSHEFVSLLLLMFGFWRILLAFLYEIILEQVGDEGSDQSLSNDAKTIMDSTDIS